jgi:hypothetical protein
MKVPLRLRSRARYLEALGPTEFEFPEDGYQGALHPGRPRTLVDARIAKLSST